MSRLVVIEGLDGAGTTTQAQRLTAHLEGRGCSVHLTREPSDNPIGRLLREFLVGGHAIGDQEIDPATLALLFAADRMDHLQREVEPQLASGRIVVSDRWYHSSLAYQASELASFPQTGGFDGRADRWCAARDVRDRYRWVAELNVRARRPDLTIFLRVDPAVAARRRVDAGRARELFDDLEVQRRVDAGYRAAIDLATERGERVEIFDGEASIEEVGARVAALVDELIDGQAPGGSAILQGSSR